MYYHIVWEQRVKYNKDKQVICLKKSVRAIANVAPCTPARDYFVKYEIVRITEFDQFDLTSIDTSEIKTNNL